MKDTTVYQRNEYNPEWPTIYRIGTGQYLNEIDVMNSRGKVDPQKVRKLLENRKDSYDMRMHSMFRNHNGNNRRHDVIMMDKNYEKTEKTKRKHFYLPEYEEEMGHLKPGVFDVDTWMEHNKIPSTFLDVVERTPHGPIILTFFISFLFAIISSAFLLIGMDTGHPIIAMIGGGIFGGLAYQLFYCNMHIIVTS